MQGKNWVRVLWWIKVILFSDNFRSRVIYSDFDTIWIGWTKQCVNRWAYERKFLIQRVECNRWCRKRKMLSERHKYMSKFNILESTLISMKLDKNKQVKWAASDISVNQLLTFSELYGNESCSRIVSLIPYRERFRRKRGDLEKLTRQRKTWQKKFETSFV